MSIPYKCGFEAGSVTRARLTPDNAYFSVLDTLANRPPDSPSHWYLQYSYTLGGICLIPWYDDATGGRYEAPDTGYNFHFRYYAGSNDANNDGRRFGVGCTGVPIIEVSTEDTSNLVTILIAGSVVATAASYAIATAAWERLICKVTAIAEGSAIHVYADGNMSTPVVSYTLTAGDVTTIQTIGLPNEFCVTAIGTSSYWWDDLVLQDPNDGIGSCNIAHLGSCGIRGSVFTADGTYTGWSGTYADIDEVPADDTAFASAAAADDHSSFTIPALTGTAQAVIHVSVLARVLKGDSTAGDNIEVELDDGVAPASVALPAPGDGDVTVNFDLAPDGGDWSVAKLDAVEFGFYSRT